jgi:hypothetical protein
MREKYGKTIPVTNDSMAHAYFMLITTSTHTHSVYVILIAFPQQQLLQELAPTQRYTECPTRYRTRHFLNDSNTNEDITTKFEQGYVRCVRNEEECVCSVCL